LISSFFHIPFEQTLHLPITQFRLLYNQALNIGNFVNSGQLELKTHKEKQNELRAQFEYLVKMGLYKWPKN